MTLWQWRQEQRARVLGLLLTGAGVVTGGVGDGTTGVTAGMNGTPAAANAPAPGVAGVVTVGATPTGPFVVPPATAPPSLAALCQYP